MPACLICLDEGAEEPPPCRGTLAPLFHLDCLHMALSAQREGPQRCPHCNTRMEAGVTATPRIWAQMVKHMVRGKLDQWFQDLSFWSQPHEYIKVKDRQLLPMEEAETLLGMLQQTILEYMRRAFLNHSANVGVSLHQHFDSEETVWVCWCVDRPQAVKTTIGVARMAILGSMGSFLHDGFSLMAERKRYVARVDPQLGF